MDKVINLTETVCCSVAEAFQCFTDVRRVCQWLTLEANITPQVAGEYELFWDPENKNINSTIGCKITAISKNQLLAFEWKSPVMFKSFANTGDPLTHVVVSFHSLGDKTVIHLIHSGWRASPEWQEACAWQQRAWETAFDNLKSMFF
ncbi:SRPBCC family protein [Alteromonas lipolytica]|uniref:Activator of Hsp90 ATPase homologue 1/2-like C-terminal domain-containing protein n=1 Tax=Alteromonas lipolytica TaxID=1856405 RepID=A0A1E8FF63_9ALTE|nr:SRPBCC domain-containing protein [Alteromonas lipolytica]OFI34550.1 hypothetical protein BFC17_13200 [Alteromonas lipolytica]GGF52019.1 hypothetical protein GCM10011338_00140 [Alteromonas lipolytica]